MARDLDQNVSFSLTVLGVLRRTVSSLQKARRVCEIGRENEVGLLLFGDVEQSPCEWMCVAFSTSGIRQGRSGSHDRLSVSRVGSSGRCERGTASRMKLRMLKSRLSMLVFYGSPSDV
jgi:hypothetical protein